MKKIALLLMLIMSMNAHALTKSQFVGDWKCTTDFKANNGSREHSVTYDTINADGSMSQLWEVVNYDNIGALASVEHLTIKNRWRVKKDRLYIYDFNITNYMAYDEEKLPYDDEYLTYFKQGWLEIYKEPYDSKVKFINKDLFVFPEENGNSHTQCERFVKEAV